VTVVVTGLDRDDESKAGEPQDFQEINAKPAYVSEPKQDLTMNKEPKNEEPYLDIPTFLKRHEDA
jgi:hypothetical protein